MAITVSIIKQPKIYMMVITTFVDRIVQEEIWAQTLWPDGEEPLTDEIVGFLDGPELELVMLRARKTLNVEALGWEQ